MNPLSMPITDKPHIIHDTICIHKKKIGNKKIVSKFHVGNLPISLNSFICRFKLKITIIGKKEKKCLITYNLSFYCVIIYYLLFCIKNA